MSDFVNNPYCVDKSLQFDAEGRLYYPSVPSLWPWKRQAHSTPAQNPYTPPVHSHPYYNRPPSHNPAISPPAARGKHVQFLTPLTSYPTPSAPPYHTTEFKNISPPLYSKYDSHFYDKHLFYQVLGVFQYDTFQTIQAARTNIYRQVAQMLKKHENLNDFVKIMILKWALNKFVNSDYRQQYDAHGDEESNISPSTETTYYLYPEFHQNHMLYVVAGACKSDGPEEIDSALQKSVLRVLRDKSNSAAARKFKNDWYNACYILSDKQRKVEYDNGDRFGDSGVPHIVKSYSTSTRL